MDQDSKADSEEPTGKLTTSKLAAKLGLKTTQLQERLVSSGFHELHSGKPYLTDKGKNAGGEFRMNGKFGAYFLWPESFHV